jgi:hypothetical protein
LPIKDYQNGVKKIPTACITVEDAEMMWRMAQRGNFTKYIISPPSSICLFGVEKQCLPFTCSILYKMDLANFHFGTVHYQFWGYREEMLKLVKRQCRAWSDCMDVQVGLVLNCWLKLITFISSLERVKRILG